MNTYIALLRGINVSGKNMVSMKALERSMALLKFTNVRTYIQSGNILFESNEKDLLKLEEVIAGKILADFSVRVPVMVISRGEVERIRNNNPFLPGKTGNEDKLHVTLLKDHPAKELTNKP